jgi:hypothetical protein
LVEELRHTGGREDDRHQHLDPNHKRPHSFILARQPVFMPLLRVVGNTASDGGRGGAPMATAFEAFGVCLLVSTDSPEIYERLPGILPPGAIACSAEYAKCRLALDIRPGGTFGLSVDDDPFLPGLPLEVALEVLQSQLHLHIATDAPDRVFVHAGVVGLGETAIVIPGGSFSGKTALVAEFVRAGAVYYSDEFAVLDDQGLVHPYPKPLSLRGEDHQQVDHSVASLGGTEGDCPLPVGTILVSAYRPGAEWRPSTLSAGEGVLAMVANSVPARTRPAEVLRSVTRAAEGATVLKGDRGEASLVVSQLLAEVSA